MKRIGYLFDEVISIENLRTAHFEEKKKKRHRRRAEQWERHLEANLERLHADLASGAWKMHEYHRKDVYEAGKQREIWFTACWDDQVVQRAICRTLGVKLEASMISGTYASMKGRGIHRALRHMWRLIRREIMPESLWVYQFDIRKFYDNIDHGCLKSALEHKIKDRRLLELLFIIIDCFPCSGYLQQHPTASRDRGIPIGNIVSPLFSNFLLSDLDHWAKEQFKAAGYYRYADDVVALLQSKDQARDFRTAVHERISALKLTIKPSEQIYPFRAWPIDFIGYVVSPYTIRLRKRIERRLRRCIRLYHTKRSQHLAASVASRWGWVKHISHAGRLWFTLTNKTASNIIKEAQSC